MADNKQQNERWYYDSDINALLNYRLSHDQEVEVATAMLGTDWLLTEEGKSHHGNELKHYLEQFQLTDNKTKAFFPINLHNNHWVLLYITYQEKQPHTIAYFDPKGSEIPAVITESVASVYPKATILNLASPLQDEGDNDNCGPWIVEAAQSLVKAGGLPEDLDIEAVRKDQEAILATLNPNKASLHITVMQDDSALNTEKPQNISKGLRSLCNNGTFAEWKVKRVKEYDRILPTEAEHDPAEDVLVYNDKVTCDDPTKNSMKIMSEVMFESQAKEVLITDGLEDDVKKLAEICEKRGLVAYIIHEGETVKFREVFAKDEEQIGITNNFKIPAPPVTKNTELLIEKMIGTILKQSQEYFDNGNISSCAKSLAYLELKIQEDESSVSAALRDKYAALKKELDQHLDMEALTKRLANLKYDSRRDYRP